MKNRLAKKATAIGAAGLIIATMQIVSAATPAAAATSCQGAGYLCVYDNATPSSPWGSIPGNVTNWTNLTGNWNDRADWYENHGTSCNVDLYVNANYLGASTVLLMGESTDWRPNSVSSNRWCQH